MSLWTLGDIKTLVRDVTALKSVNQLSDALLEDEINRFYAYQFPLEVKPLELQDWWEFTTTQSDADVALDDDNIVTIAEPAYIDGYTLKIWYDPSAFYEKWPLTQTHTENRPTDALFYKRELLLRAPPDDAYDIKIAAWARPAILTDDSTSNPTRPQWGPCIAYGTARNILWRSGDSERANEVMIMYHNAKINIDAKQVEQLSQVRAKPKF
jgi:hypothetical protein